jgi:hypothetical protein
MLEQLLSLRAELQGCPVALVGALAVGVHTEPRFTRDIDIACGVDGDQQAEQLVRRLQNRGWKVLAVLEQTTLGRLATVRLQAQDRSGTIADLLFASSGVEAELTRTAEDLEVLEGVRFPVARLPFLIALKLLARDDQRRPQDRVDLQKLLAVASETDREQTLAILALIHERGFDRGRDLTRLFAESLAEFQ